MGLDRFVRQDRWHSAHLVHTRILLASTWYVYHVLPITLVLL